MLSNMGSEETRRAALYFAIGALITLLITQIIVDIPLGQSISTAIGIGISMAIMAFFVQNS